MVSTAHSICVPSTSAPGQGESWELRLGEVTLTAQQSVVRDFPGIIFQNDGDPTTIDPVQTVDGHRFILDTNGSPANFRVIYVQ